MPARKPSTHYDWLIKVLMKSQGRDLAAWLLGEKLSPLQAVGAAVILGGVYLTRTGYRFFPGNRPIPD